MPYNVGTGIYSITANALGVEGDEIDPDYYNAQVRDEEAAHNYPRPIVAGGTGATTAANARTNLGLGDSATRNVGTTAGTVTAGDDARLAYPNSVAVREGAATIGVVSPKTGRDAAEWWRARTGRVTFGGSTGDQAIAGAGATDYVGAFGKHTYSNNGYEILGSSGYVDCFYVHLNSAPGSGNTITCTLQVQNGVGGRVNLHKLTFTGSERVKGVDYDKYFVLRGSGLDIKVETTSGVAAAAITVTWGAGFTPAPLDRMALSIYPETTQAPTIVKPVSPDLYSEATPWRVNIPQISDTFFLAPTGFSALCRSANALTASTINIASATYVSEVSTSVPWRRNYDGAYSAHTTDPGTANQIIWYLRHGENKNEIVGGHGGAGTQLVNTVNPSIGITVGDTNTWSGYRSPGVYGDGYAAYFSFVTLSYVPSTSGNGYGVGVAATDLGPIMWPAAGYLKSDGTSASLGLRHPTFYADATYLYVFASETSAGSQADGIIVARASIAAIKAASDADKPKQFYTWCGAAGWLPSLPTGFDKSNIASFWNVPGPPAVAITQHHDYSGRFAVAKVSGASYYLAVSQYGARVDFSDASLPIIWNTALLKSDDLINWREVALVSQGQSTGGFALNYPVFLNVAGNDHFNIDLNDFYLLGTSFAPPNQINRRRMLYGQFVSP